MKIIINHLAKMEGHASFIGSLEDGDIAKAKIITEEGVRLIEGCLKGKSIFDAHVIAMRICGICPVVHNLAAIKAMENALEIQVSQQTIKLRKLMELGQIIHSHCLHLFFLSLPDFFNFDDSHLLVKKYPREAQMAMRLRAFGNIINEHIGGRAIHPLNNWIGGFKVLPDKKKLEEIKRQSVAALTDAVALAKFFAALKYPKYERKSEYLSLNSLDEYAIYDGKVMSADGFEYSPLNFFKKVQEVEEGLAAKRAVWLNSHFMVGALARINNHGLQLNPQAKKIWQKACGQKKVYNPFYNILAQAVEVVHAVEEAQKILADLKIKDEINNDVQIKAGRGLAAVEAPRGLLIHYYEITKTGRIAKADIITPTVMFLGNLEDDLAAYLPTTKSMSDADRRQKIKMLIRAYDPCISCATH